MTINIKMKIYLILNLKDMKINCLFIFLMGVFMLGCKPDGDSPLPQHQFFDLFLNINDSNGLIFQKVF